MRPAGYFVSTDPDGRITEGETLQCVHCNAHWIVRPGSGIKRGWCLRCMGPHCGQAACWSCEPFEKKLERWEMRERLVQAARKTLCLDS